MIETGNALRLSLNHIEPFLTFKRGIRWLFWERITIVLGNIGGTVAGLFVFRHGAEKLCGEWVLSASVGGTGGFSAPTATHLTSGSAHGPQTFSAS